MKDYKDYKAPPTFHLAAFCIIGIISILAFLGWLDDTDNKQPILVMECNDKK